MGLGVGNNNTITPIEEHLEHHKEPPYPPSETDSPQAFPFKASRKNPTISPADERVAMLIRVCGLDLTVPAHVTQAQNAAAQLSSYMAETIGARYLPSGAAGEGWNWYRDDWRGRGGDMPTTKQVVETISLERLAVTVKEKSNVTERKFSNAEVGGAEYAVLRQQLVRSRS